VIFLPAFRAEFPLKLCPAILTIFNFSIHCVGRLADCCQIIQQHLMIILPANILICFEGLCQPRTISAAFALLLRGNHLEDIFRLACDVVFDGEFLAENPPAEGPHVGHDRYVVGQELEGIVIQVPEIP